ncbi:MAG: DinB family protein [Bacteroidota bacterium]
MNGNSFIDEFKSQSIHQMELNLPRIKKCFNMLSEEEIWKRPNESSNSIGNLILHLCGNIHQYVISSLGNRPDIRERDLEFATQGGYQKDELFIKLTETVEEALGIILDVPEDELLRKRTVQGFNHSGIGIVIHVTEHFSYHTGQIAFWTKLLKDKDLGFYSALDLNKKNE